MTSRHIHYNLSQPSAISADNVSIKFESSMAHRLDLLLCLRDRLAAHSIEPSTERSRCDLCNRLAFSRRRLGSNRVQEFIQY